MSDDANFAQLGQMDIGSAGDVFEGCEFIRKRAGNAGLIIVQWANDLEYALASVPILQQGGLMPDTPQKRARRVARHAYRAAEAMRTVGEAAAKVPPAYLRTYQDVIQQRRQRRAFDPKAGI